MWREYTINGTPASFFSIYEFVESICCASWHGLLFYSRFKFLLPHFSFVFEHGKWNACTHARTHESAHECGPTVRCICCVVTFITTHWHFSFFVIFLLHLQLHYNQLMIINEWIYAICKLQQMNARMKLMIHTHCELITMKSKRSHAARVPTTITTANMK